ncbi:hypothetical protein Ahy_B10g104126 [Arachis hypogaea]|uniref:Uncharacterized protein n=1 Tax=Arachis hypogaea TaxID=3818 RepID=A0A444X4S3_ARAHY|nr:hypothetical protein Ahy_B10g104126 [Arachis hypogaea]
MAEMQEYKVKSKGKYLLSHEDASLDDINDLQSPSHGELMMQSNSSLYYGHIMNYQFRDLKQ